MNIDRRQFLAAATAGATALACSRARRPNVVLILADDHRADCLSCAGHPFLKTPHLDRLAAEGARFANAFTTSALSAPSRASFLSGQYAHRHRVLDSATAYPESLPSYPRVLQSAGYHTGYIGKWDMGKENDEARPGFEYWAGYKGSGQNYDTEFNVNGTRQLLKGSYTRVVTNLATEWLKSATRPFALILGHKAPQPPWVPEPKYAHAFDAVTIKKPDAALGPDTPDWVRQRAKTVHGSDGPLSDTNDFATVVRAYYQAILSVDDSVGQIYGSLRAIGELDNTILVFASDNGFLLGEHASIDARAAWEESIRIPLLIRYPPLVRGARVVTQMALNLDLAPTLADICAASGLVTTNGQSLAPLMQGHGEGWRSSWLYEYNFENEFPHTPNIRAVRTDDWKYIHYPNGDDQPDTEMAELYNLKSDPRESTNLIAAPDAQPKLAELKKELLQLQSDSGGLPDMMTVNPELRFEPVPSGAVSLPMPSER